MKNPFRTRYKICRELTHGGNLVYCVYRLSFFGWLFVDLKSEFDEARGVIEADKNPPKKMLPVTVYEE